MEFATKMVVDEVVVYGDLFAGSVRKTITLDFKNNPKLKRERIESFIDSLIDRILSLGLNMEFCITFLEATHYNFLSDGIEYKNIDDIDVIVKFDQSGEISEIEINYLVQGKDVNLLEVIF